MADPYSEPSSGYERLEAQINWYDSKSGSAQRYYKNSKIAVIIAAAAVPISALVGWAYVAAALGGLIAVLEAVQHLQQWQHNWITYRSTCEALRHRNTLILSAPTPTLTCLTRTRASCWLSALRA